jgi:hypothetical protein
VGLSSLTIPAQAAPTAAPRAVTGTFDKATALIRLESLTTVTATNSPAYNRDRFKHWVDADHNGCDSRAEVLLLETTAKTTHTGKCTIKTGKWFSPYEGVTITNAGSIDIDHMVPLKEAWVSGARTWTDAQRELYANDLGWTGSLIAVSASQNRSKSDQDPANWMPKSAAYRCTYVAVWVTVKWRWNLSVDTTERSTLTKTLSTCTDSAIVQPKF